MSGPSALPTCRREVHDRQSIWLCSAPAGQAGRVHGRVQYSGGESATLADLEQHIAFLRSLGAPDDAHPKIGVNDDYEITMMICVVERSTPRVSSAS